MGVTGSEGVPPMMALGSTDDNPRNIQMTFTGDLLWARHPIKAAGTQRRQESHARWAYRLVKVTGTIMKDYDKICIE